MEFLQKIKSIGWGHKLTAIINTTLLLVNIIWLASNIRTHQVERKNSSMEVTDRLPQFEICYYEILKEAFAYFEETGSTDSLYTDALMNLQVAKNDAIKFEYDSNSAYETVSCLGIRQIGGSIAQDVTIEFDCLTTEAGLDFFVTTSNDVFALEEMEEDVAGNKIAKKSLTINYGDIACSRGLIIPLFEVSNLRNKEDFDSEETEEEVWSLTGPVILVPKLLKYKNMYDNKSTTQEVRKMNNSSIVYSIYVEGRG